MSHRISTNIYSEFSYPFGSCISGRVFSSGGYRYGFNGKEEETDGTADYYDFGARIYDGRLGRWLAVDPKFRKYVDAGVYNFSACSPLAVNDPSGGEINITFNSHYDSKTKVTTVDVKIVITGKVLQNSHSEVSAKEVANFVNSEVIRLFNNKTINFDNGVIWNVQAESHFTEAKTMDEVAESDHLIAIVDDAEGKTASGKEIAGVAEIGGKIAYTEVQRTSGAGCSGPKLDKQSIGQCAVHELLHNFGLEDEYTKAEKDRPKQNYMDNCYVANPGITRDQLIKAINSEHNLYSNYSNASEITDKNWYDTSNSDPENSATKGKDGKVPKIIADPK